MFTFSYCFLSNTALQETHYLYWFRKPKYSNTCCFMSLGYVIKSLTNGKTVFILASSLRDRNMYFPLAWIFSYFGAQVLSVVSQPLGLRHFLIYLPFIFFTVNFHFRTVVKQNQICQYTYPIFFLVYVVLFFFRNYSG